ncbi:MAG: hypothetical protein SF187_09500 [Deltaproteobacteria bacterium]|nr:hypothetical protein [Deltaproteobacteria bacterium]
MRTLVALHTASLVCGLWAMACDGGRQGEATRGRQPATPGETVPLCDAQTPCAPGWGCVPATRDIGRCLPRGAPGALCMVGPPGEGTCNSGLLCAGKGGTCVPIVGAGQACTAAACAPPFVCDRDGSFDPVCASPGDDHGACRAQPPVCNAGLGCLAGICRALSMSGTCFANGTYTPCPTGQLCSHFFGDPGETPGKCLVPSIVGGACGDPDLGRPVCVEPALCVQGVCRLDAVPLGGTCLPQAPHVQCADAGACVRNVCISKGTETAPCRALPSAPCDPGLTCKDGACRSFIADGQSCEPKSGALVDCRAGSSCVRAGPAYVCARDGLEGGACRAGEVPCDDGLVCARNLDGTKVCRVPLPLGAPCSLAREPFEPCTAESSCSKATRVCESNGSLGAACLAEQRCDTGLWCVPDNGVNRCHLAPAAVAVGQACDTNPVASLRTNRCEAGTQCVAGLCVSWGSAGASCRPLGVAPSRCDAGLACMAGSCQPGAPVGAECLPGGDAECAAPALCVAGVCRMVNGYALTLEPREPFVDACEGGTPLALTSSLFTSAPKDDGDEVVALPFAFTFYGEPHVNIAISVNGVAGFPGPGAFLNPGAGGVLPSAGQPALIAPFWDDLVASGASGVCTKTTGIMGDRRFVVTWRRVQRFGYRDSSLTFSMLLRERDGAVTFAYDDLYAPAGSESAVSGVRATRGLQAAGGFASVQSSAAVSLTQQLSFVPLP